MMESSNEAVARELLEVVPGIMRTIRSEMRKHQANDIKVPMFRSLTYLERHPGVALLDLAGHLGLTSPSTCKIVDGLVEHGLVMRQHSSHDRRKITLALTTKGRDVLEHARAYTQAQMIERLGALSAEQCRIVLQALEILQPLFQPAGNKLMQGEAKS